MFGLNVRFLVVNFTSKILTPSLLIKLCQTAVKLCVKSTKLMTMYNCLKKTTRNNAWLTCFILKEKNIDAVTLCGYLSTAMFMLLYGKA